MSQTCPKAEVVAPPSLVTSESCQLRLGQRTLFVAIDKPEKARFPNRPSCRTRRKLAISAPRVGRLGRVICPTGSLSIWVSSPLCKNISVFADPKSLLELLSSRPTRGAYRDRHGRRSGMRWTRQRFAREGIAGRVL